MAKHNDDAKGVKIRIPRDIAERFEALGGDLEQKIINALRAHLDSDGHKTMGDRIVEAVAPLRDHPFAPQVEKAARDFATKVAKDIAAAAGTAALAAWTAGLAKKDEAAPKSAKPPKPDKPKA